MSLRAALVEAGHRRRRSRPCSREPALQLDLADDLGAGEALRELDGVADVVAVAVRDRDHVDALRRASRRPASSGCRSGTGRRRSACRGRCRAGTREWPSQVSVAIESRPFVAEALSIEGPSDPGAKLCSRGTPSASGPARASLAASPTLRAPTASPSTRCSLAVPFAAVAALVLVRRRSSSSRRAGRGAPGAAVAASSCSARALVRRAQHGVHGVPPLAVSSVVACLGIFAVKASAAAVGAARVLRPAKPSPSRDAAPLASKP